VILLIVAGVYVLEFTRYSNLDRWRLVGVISVGSGHCARLGGVDFEAALTNEPGVVNLYWRGERPPISGFEPLAPGILICRMDITQLDLVVHVRWLCEYLGEPFVVVGGNDNTLELDYDGDNFQKVSEMGFTMLGKFEVATMTVSRSEVKNLHRIERTVWLAQG